MVRNELEFTAIVHEEADGSYWTEVSELPGCFASGFNLDELKEALVESIEAWLTDESNGGVAAPKVQLSALRMLVAAKSG